MAKDTNALLPLLILTIILSILAIIGYITYTVIQGVTDATRTKMEEKNVLVSKEGLKVGVRHVGEEDYRDRTQRVLVNMWNHTSFPAYKSRIWNMAGSAAGAVSETANNMVATATASSSTTVATTGSGSGSGSEAGSTKRLSEDGRVERKGWKGRGDD